MKYSVDSCIRFYVNHIFGKELNSKCIAQYSSVRVKLHKKYLKFFNSVCNSSNTLVSMMSRIVINGSGSEACRSVNSQCCIYDLIVKYDISLFLLSNLKDSDCLLSTRNVQKQLSETDIHKKLGHKKCYTLDPQTGNHIFSQLAKNLL